MKSDFTALWAESPGSLRREPTLTELASGFPCGAADQQLFNELIFRLAGLQREAANLLAAAGITPTTADYQQIARAIQSGKVNYAVAGGTANALTATFNPSTSAGYTAGMVFHVRITATNTGAAALNGIYIRHLDGALLYGGELIAGSIAILGFDGTNFQLLNLKPRARLTSNLTVYVRLDGNDANDGTANDSAHAFQTITGALGRIRTLYDPVGFTVTIKLGQSGTYAVSGAIAVPNLGCPIVIQGDTSDQSACTIYGPGAATSALVSVVGGEVTLDSLTITNTSTTSHVLGASGSARVFVKKVSFSTTTPYSNFAAISASYAANIIIDDGCKILGDINYGFLATSSGVINFLPSITFSFVGSRTMYAATAYAQTGSIIVSSGATIAGTVTGYRYSVSLNGVINTAGGGATVFPGNAAGVSSTGGQYV